MYIFGKQTETEEKFLQSTGLLSQMPEKFQAGLGPKPRTRASTQLSHIGGKKTIIWAIMLVLLGLH